MSGWHVASVQAPIVNSDPVNGHRYQGWQPCIEWCQTQFGNRAIDGWRFVGEGVFEFREEKDYLMFLLRWA
jgi:hypothetical protein